MNWLKKFNFFALLIFAFSLLFSASLTSCGSKTDGDDKETTEHPAGEADESEHPKGDAEHPNDAKSDSTQTEDNAQ